ncbi:MAG: uracil-DNA glycosylase [Gemmatimonadetes bacterium]|nr:MAG: uracil-DNA glycosylase [Gemmatimonadota bacterium]
MPANLNRFINQLKHAPQRPDVFNPWWQTDPEYDIDESAAEIRREQLRCYLKERIGKAQFLLLAEAIGYQGGHFSGIAMTSERILLGGKTHQGIIPQMVFQSIPPQRTSKPELKPNGFSENTATIVWGKIIELGLDPYDIILWNAYPWHPFKPEKGGLTNRTPDAGELAVGCQLLKQMIHLTGVRHVIAIGNKSHQVLQRAGVATVKVRHPANGGATQFRNQFEAYLQSIMYG